MSAYLPHQLVAVDPEADAARRLESFDRAHSRASHREIPDDAPCLASSKLPSCSAPGGGGVSPGSTVQPRNPSSPNNCSGVGRTSQLSGSASPITSLAGRPLRSSRFLRNPASTASATRRETADLSSRRSDLRSAWRTSSRPSSSRRRTISTTSRTSRLTVASTPTATRSATNSHTTR